MAMLTNSCYVLSTSDILGIIFLYEISKINGQVYKWIWAFIITSTPSS